MVLAATFLFCLRRWQRLCVQKQLLGRRQTGAIIELADRTSKERKHRPPSAARRSEGIRHESSSYGRSPRGSLGRINRLPSSQSAQISRRRLHVV